MKQFLIPLLCLAILIAIAGCADSHVNIETNSAMASTTPASTITAPTTQPVPTTQATNRTTRPSRPPTEPTPPPPVEFVPNPTISSDDSPVKGDLYWGEFEGKRFLNIDGYFEPVVQVVLYTDGTCKYTLSMFSSSVAGPTVWSFDGEYLYIGSVESGSYSVFLHVGAEDPNKSKLIFIKSDHDMGYFCQLPDGQEFAFGGVLYWEEES